MKSRRLSAVKRDWNTISRGLRNSARSLIEWINASSDKDIVKRRLVITAGVPCGFMFLGSQYPVIAVTGSFTLLIGCVFWFAHVEERHMTFHSADFEGPYQLGQRIVDLPELLRHLAASHPDACMDDIADLVYERFGGPDLDAEGLSRLMASLGIRHAALESPSPTGPYSSPSPGEERGQGSAEGDPEAVGAGQGRGGALRKVMRLASSGTQYAVALAKERKNDEHQPGEQGARGVDQPAQEERSARGEEHLGGVGERQDLRDPDGGEGDARGIPGADGRHLEVPPQVADGAAPTEQHQDVA